MSEHKKYNIIHDRDICIGCSACASVCPKHWIMEPDGKSSIVNHVKSGNGEEELLGSNDDPLSSTAWLRGGYCWAIRVGFLGPRNPIHNPPKKPNFR